MTNYNYIFIFATSAVLVLISILMMYYMTAPAGIGVSPDSVSYLSASSSLITGDGFVGLTGTPSPYRPPLFATLLGAIRLLGLDPVNIMPYVQGFFLGATGALGVFLSFLFSRSWVLSVCVGLALVIGRPLVDVASFLWAESMYTFFMVSVVIATIFYLRQPSFQRLAILGVLCALAFLLRYAGFSLVLAASLSILMFGNFPIKTKFVNTFVLGLISCLPVSIWILRNILVTDTMTGSRYFSADLLFPALETSLAILGQWFIPKRFGNEAEIVLGLVIIFGAISMPLYAFCKKKERVLLELSVPSVYIVVYFLFMVFSQMVACCAGRFLAPLYPVVIAFMFGLLALIVFHRGATNRYLQLSKIALATMVTGTVLTISGGKTLSSIQVFREDGGGYNSPIWKQNSNIGYLKQHPFGEDVCMYSNAPGALAFLLGVRCVKYGPLKKPYYHERVVLDQRAQVASTMETLNTRVLLVWFDGFASDQYFEPDSLTDFFMVERVVRTADGAIYEIKPRPSHDGSRNME